ncbi:MULTISPECIES: redox-sensing transcriptional repressor Rex [unclassified Candidatus Frackibacter]|uniref:redox-sensing transcriptional repressor Rex n=1 Tax=unclassified Candidatus Frackibacter TaxID=2648818 RepID=UPI000796CCBB|nr:MULTISPECIES: redox-sensing transcriptional repressor Rex [unclassified Candidatus Frackibacter]KXS43733.1 MAG: CoA-binding protein [Candidatus Frackibacter sp. T328-2]SDC20574.1 redox-sensing transcriptional repressor [Candidatus Frackibacter sp. WG11]SEM51127.1 redox-sensing transcriptional repressor [Candidatus Frackibacter sp. WG12]SFL52401.1 redox-sensing transcriptional repressor [Candidatus Frackibacter sp. WG13]
MIPDNTIRRLSLYLRVLEKLKAKGTEVISSKQLEEEFGLKATQFRKDLTYFGEFGVRGVGYEVEDLLKKLKKILGMNEEKTAVLIGTGHIGTALLNFNQQNQNCKVRIEAALDNSQDKIGSKVGAIEVKPIGNIPEVVAQIKPAIGIVAVSPDAAQKVVDLLIEYDVKILLNFAPVNLEVPYDVYLQNVDLTLELQNLLYYSENLAK